MVKSLVLNQMRSGLEIEVLTSVPRGSGRVAWRDASYVRRFRAWTIANTPVFPALLVALLRLPRRSLIHLHIAQAFTPEMVYIAHKLRGLPYVAHLHLDVGPSGWAGFLLRIWKPLVLGPVLRNASKVVVFTEEQRTAVASKYAVDLARLEVIHNGVEPKYFSAARCLERAKPRLLFVGRLSAQKNLQMLLHALEGVSHRFETVIVGDGELGDALRGCAAELDLANIRFHGRAEGQELVELYRTSDVFVLPSEREGMPLVLLEAMAMGLPTIATDVTGSRDVVVNGKTGVLVPLGDHEAMRKALCDLTNDPGVYARMSLLSREAAQHYSWTDVVAHFAFLYRKISAEDR